MKESDRSGFGSRFGAILAMVGSAVGLGNIWRFPYLVGENGGGAFILIYIVFSILISLPVFCAEVIIGRRGRASAVGAFRNLAPGSKWHLAGYLSILAVFLILSFYSVVGGWSIKYLVDSAMLKFSAGADADFSELFSSFSTATWSPLIYMLVFILINSAVVILGVKNGIERFSKWMMPLLFLLILILVVRSACLPGAGVGYNYLFHADFTKINSDTLMAALGQSFFSMSLGMGAMIIYGSYVSRKDSIASHAVVTLSLDTLFAILAACAIMPAVFSFGLQPNQGPGLVFVTLPYLFSNMPLGTIVAIFFFISLLLAAISSAISLLEVMTSFLIEEFHLSRRQAVTICIAIQVVFGTLCSFSLQAGSPLKLAGLSLFDLFDKVSSDYVMTIGALLTVIFVGWKIKRSDYLDEMTSGGAVHLPRWAAEVIYWLIKVVAPLAILAILIL
ncbi:MAG: sodium-dependent transporter [Bacteroidales bacterium]|nr:sodium-dependent transporter [Bacteroidales bacterium]